MSKVFTSAQILLPASQIDRSKWAVIACDQFTSEPEYWNQVEEKVGESPSTLSLIYPEVYLGGDDSRISKIRDTMIQYLRDGVFDTAVEDGYVFVIRTTESGRRLGLVGALDLEAYDFHPDRKALVRATEQTVASRIPPRMKVRLDASVESPHVMVLMEDIRYHILRDLSRKTDTLDKLYDVELMLGGGHLEGYAVTGQEAQHLNVLFDEMEDRCGGLLFAVGDGNHSLATAKACWEEIKKNLSDEEARSHPARYALVELCDLHDPSLVFEPIHRILFGGQMDAVTEYFEKALQREGMSLVPGDEIVFTQGDMRRQTAIQGRGDRLPVEVLQKVLDAYLEEHSEVEIDYIHGTDSLNNLVEESGGLGIALQAIDKQSLFPAIQAGGVLPRKTFSIGEAHEKRYYMECRKIR